MTVQELYNWCKAQKHKEAEVYLVKDWELCDWQGCLMDLYRLRGISMQTHIADTGLDFIDVHEALMDFEEERA